MGERKGGEERSGDQQSGKARSKSPVWLHFHQAAKIERLSKYYYHNRNMMSATHPKCPLWAKSGSQTSLLILLFDHNRGIKHDRFLTRARPNNHPNDPTPGLLQIDVINPPGSI